MKYNYLSKSSSYKAAFLALLGSCFANDIKAQDNYSVTSIPFQVYQTTVAVQNTSDDTFSAPIPLTFDFDFYGNVYNQVNVSTNGYISFTPYALGAFSPWVINVATPIPNANFVVKNAFLGCFHDLYSNNGQGSITYAVVGSAPYRRFVVMFDNNSLFQCQTSTSSFQMVLYETLNILDVQLIDKQGCPTWNQGTAVTGIINSTGLSGVAAPGRNVGSWTAYHEGWRFQRPFSTNTYLFAKCDDDTDGIVNFDLQVVQNDLSLANPSLVSFYESESDALSQINALSNLNYTNTTAGSQTIYANMDGEVKSVRLQVVDCNNDYDLDSVLTADEDVNTDTNLANDDTDVDGIANFIDNDDDGDMVLTSVEYVFNRNADPTTSILDTDSDGIPNYLDSDDDGDGMLTINEDANGNNNPLDDDADNNGTPDYLQNPALSVRNFTNRDSIVLYPNPADAVLNIENKTGEAISAITIYSVNGSLVKEIKTADTVKAISVSDLQSGVYFVKIVSSNEVLNYKFIKK